MFRSNWKYLHEHVYVLCGALYIMQSPKAIRWSLSVCASAQMPANNEGTGYVNGWNCTVWVRAPGYIIICNTYKIYRAIDTRVLYVQIWAFILYVLFVLCSTKYKGIKTKPPYLMAHYVQIKYVYDTESSRMLLTCCLAITQKLLNFSESRGSGCVSLSFVRLYILLLQRDFVLFALFRKPFCHILVH